MAIFLLLPLLAGTLNSFQTFDNESIFQERFEKPCDMCCCSSDGTACPLCNTSSSFYPYLPRKAAEYLPVLHSSFILINYTFSDQGIVKAIFHPPTSIL